MSLKQDILILNYKTSNIKSIFNAIKLYDDDVKISSNYKDLKNADKVILPGVGHFGMAFQNLKELNIIPTLRELAEKKKLFLGVCLGMQLLADASEEAPNIKGLGFIPGVVKKFNEKCKSKIKLPHIGWNEIKIKKSTDLTKDILSNSDFYFVHSYHFECDEKYVLAKTPYGINFNSIINKDNFFGCQFHPEKSLKSGLKLIKNFVDL